jgi:AtzE family amidohydrolase
MSILEGSWSAAQTAREVAAGQVLASSVTAAALARIEGGNAPLNAFSAVLAERAKMRATKIDAAIAQGYSVGPLAGVPFAVKNLYDVKGLTTLAGSRINEGLPPASRDARVVERLEAAGAVLVGALNMSEYAYDYTGEAVHSGPIRNPHDLSRMAGGSSGGSSSAVGAGLVPLALGSDTNGSIRVPASYCGVYGLKPTFGRLSRAGTFPFVASLDHVGPLARTAEDLALSYDAMQGFDPEDASCSRRAVELTVPALTDGVDGLRIAVAGGHFQKHLFPEATEALNRVTQKLGVVRTLELPESDRARAASLVITSCEGAALHLDRLRERAVDMDPVTRDRLLSGAMLPAPLVERSHRFRRWYRDEVLKRFADIDVLIAPATPFAAPRIGETSLDLNGIPMPIRLMMGEFTIPFSFVGFPAVVVPVPLKPMPIGIQVIAKPWREVDALRVAFALERAGVTGAMLPRPSAGRTALS